MAPRKEKTEKASADQGATLILDYLRKQNRPYSATDISANLHNKVTKTNAAKTLKEMHERNEIAGRPAGKQTVYHTLQDANDVASPEQLAALDQEAEAIREEIVAAKSNEKLLKANLATLNTTLSTEDLSGAVVALELEKEEIWARLVPLRSGCAKPVSAEEKRDVDRAWTQWQRQWIVRKKIAMDVWAHATEVVPEGTTKEELWDGLGMEIDP